MRLSRKNIVLYVFVLPSSCLGQDSSNYSLNFDGGSNYVDFGEGNGILIHINIL